MPYTLLYHPKVKEEDLPGLNRRSLQTICRAIASRLATQPEKYGNPLRGTLKSYWKLRVGDHRVVYKITGTEVWILAIIHRRKIYAEVLKRVKWTPGTAPRKTEFSSPGPK